MMGYYERKVVGGLVGGMLIVCVVSLVAVGPWIWGDNVGGPVIGAVFEAVYLALIGWWLTAVYRKSRREALARAERRAAVVSYRAQMMMTNTPWHDAEAGFIRHGTCTIKHRSVGAAARCKSQI